MAATKYTYSISTDFSSGENSDSLTEEILTSSISSAALTHINTDGDVCNIWFDDPLSAGDQTTLDGLVAAHSGVAPLQWEVVFVPAPLKSVEAGASEVIANSRPAIEVQDGYTAFGAASFPWIKPGSHTTIRIHGHFILKQAGTGTKVRLAAKVKAQGVGEDSSSAFSPQGFSVVTVTHTTVGEVFEGSIDLDASGIEHEDSVAVHIGRDGNNEMGAGDNDDVNVPIQILDVHVEVV
jgi:hypothetical protein